jgi:hypothetical protein
MKNFDTGERMLLVIALREWYNRDKKSLVTKEGRAKIHELTQLLLDTVSEDLKKDA